MVWQAFYLLPNFCLCVYAGKLKRIPTLVPIALRDAIINYGTVDEKEGTEAANFIAECLHLDPAARWTASQLLAHPWMNRGPPPNCHGIKFI